jgi:hypothetical protein
MLHLPFFSLDLESTRNWTLDFVKDSFPRQKEIVGVNRYNIRSSHIQNSNCHQGCKVEKVSMMVAEHHKAPCRLYSSLKVALKPIPCFSSPTSRCRLAFYRDIYKTLFGGEYVPMHGRFITIS